MNHELYMRVAIEEALSAANAEEVPIGAVAVIDGEIKARSHNVRESTNNPLGHAEILVLQSLISQKIFPSWRCEGVTIYSTVEPCMMCMGALLHARVPKLVFGCRDKKFGACGSLYNFASDNKMNHTIEVVSGVLEDECAKIMSDFFKSLRENK